MTIIKQRGKYVFPESVSVGSGGRIGGMDSNAVDFVLGSVTNATAKEVTALVAGVAVGDLVLSGSPATLPANLIWGGMFVSGAGTVTCRVANPTAAPIAGGTVNAKFLHYKGQ